MPTLNLLARASQLLAATLALAAGGVFAGGLPEANDPSQAAPASTDRLIVKYRDSRVAALQARETSLSAARLQTLQAQAARFGTQMQLLRHNSLGAHVLKMDRALPLREAAALAAALKAGDAGVEYAEPDRLLMPQFAPNDPSYAAQWPLHENTGGIRAAQAWDLSRGAGVTVAVLDTGYRAHADLAPNIVPGWDFIASTRIANDGDGRDSDARDPGDWTAADECRVGSAASNSSWHGTHVAGTIGAVANNGAGVAGVAFGAKVQPLRVLGKCGGYTSDIADAIVWAAGGSVVGVPANATPARVLNLSLGGPGACDSTTQNAINAARARNAVVVVAAGNSATDAGSFSPASCAGVITVAATDRYGARAYYSNHGAAVALAAPGGDVRASASGGILSTLNNGTQGPAADVLAYYQGTSMAAPHVAGVAALMIARNPALTPDQVAATLKATARAFPGACSGCGSGLLDAHAAVQAVAAPTTTLAERESNNSRGTAQVVTRPVTVEGTVATTSDTDWFAVDLPGRQTLTSTLTPGSTKANFDLYVYDSAGTLIGTSRGAAGLTETVTVTNPHAFTARRFVRVVYAGGATGAYRLQLKW